MWWAYSGISCVAFTTMFLVLKNVSGSLSPAQLMLFVYSFALLFFFVHLCITKQLTFPTYSVIGLILVASVFSYLGNLFQFKAIDEAPNPGYVVAIVSFDSVLLVIASALLFGSSFGTVKLIGTVLCVAGLALLAL